MTPVELDPDELTLTKEPQQARSRRTLERLREAAWDLLEQEGVEGLTVNAVSAGARVSVGSFYARFEGKEELLDHLEAVALEASIRSWTDAAEAVHSTAMAGGAAESADLERGIEDLLAHLLHLYRRGPARRLLLLSRADGRSSARLNLLHRVVAEALARVTAPRPASSAVSWSGSPSAPSPGSEDLLRGAALAAAARELALSLEGPSRAWLFGDSPEAGADRRILHTLMGLARETGSSGSGAEASRLPAFPVPTSPVPASPPEAPDEGPDEAPEAEPDPEPVAEPDAEPDAEQDAEQDAEPVDEPDEEPPPPAVELFDVWG